ncbi:uncharacterized protein BDR25DRAFT_361600 [Lindgomyces ingoldianus]|uniref:Uncharacterized protein n=1 Tax=Lindgomyces ingoldianus TaxID=673940 RepID=A0ACB6QC81_9PLEO|nr:uncharacterized protein BDR25DRAFT_361600 [Lindgomyces ingoldianus]KAF2464521.1 hypothetical protein BDR25DRAFT_361600 [Lindgomyces ingoldianus]
MPQEADARKCTSLTDLDSCIDNRDSEHNFGRIVLMEITYLNELKPAPGPPAAGRTSEHMISYFSSESEKWWSSENCPVRQTSQIGYRVISTYKSSTMRAVQQIYEVIVLLDLNKDRSYCINPCIETRELRHDEGCKPRLCSVGFFPNQIQRLTKENMRSWMAKRQDLGNRRDGLGGY